MPADTDVAAGSFKGTAFIHRTGNKRQNFWGISIPLPKEKENKNTQCK